MEIFDFTSKNKYNNTNNFVYTDSVLKGRFVCNGQRYSKNYIFLLRNSHYTSWWNVSFSPILQKTKVKEVIPTRNSYYQAWQQSISYFRFTYSYYLHNGCWNSTDKKFQNSSVQWFYPETTGFNQVSFTKQINQISAKICIKYAPDIISGIKKVHNNLQLRIFFYLYQRTSFILDIDSTVLPLYGRKIQGAEIGYNPTKRGRPSYHPLLVFEGHTQESWGGIQRPGNVASSTDSIPFVKVCLTKIPKNIYRIRLRADEGFYSWNMVNFLDGEKVGFVIVAKITAPIKCMLPGLKYHTFRKGWKCAEFKYQPDKWEKHYRFVAVRKLINQEEPAVTLFTIEDYAYHIYVTNLFLQPQEVFHFYNGRCHAELDIKELKINLPLAKIPTRNFVANEAYLQIILLAYNLVVWFKIFCLPKKFQKKKLMNLRLDLLMLPARLVKSGSHNILKLPVGYIYQREFFHILQNIQKLKIPK